MLPNSNHLSLFRSQTQHSSIIYTNSICMDQAKLHEFCNSIMTSNSIQKVVEYEQLLHDEDSLIRILSNLCSSKQIYFVTSEVFLRMMKKNNFTLKIKLTNSFIPLGQSLNILRHKHRINRIIQDKYLEILSQNFSFLQKHECNQALQIISHTLSQILNECKENQQPHLRFISFLYPGYQNWQKSTGFNILSFVTDYQSFGSLKETDIVFPENVEMYKVLLNTISSVIEMKENREEEKYSDSQFSTNFRNFKNRYMQDWAQFAIQQAKIVFNLYLNQEKVLFSHIVLFDMVKLLRNVIMFTYESLSQRTHEGEKDKYVKTPQYSFPEGILKLIGEDQTFLEVLHQIHAKVTSQNQHSQSFQANSQQNNDYLLSQSKVIQVCSMIFQMYGRVFFCTTSSQKYNNNETLIMQNLVQIQEVPSYLKLQLTKISILSEIIQNPSQFLCNKAIKSLESTTKQRYRLYYAIVQIVTKFVFYSRCIEQPNTLSHSPSSQIKSQIRQKMKQFLAEVITFAHGHCLQQECWKIMYGEEEEGLENDEIFTDLRHSEIFFPQKVFELMYPLHQNIDAKFLNPLTELNAIKQFYVRYFQIAGEFLGKLQIEFTNKISQLITDDFALEYSMMHDFFKALPYVKIKENKILAIPTKYKPHDLKFIQQSYQPKQPSEGQKVLDYFQKFDELITNISVAIYSKVQISSETNTPQNLSFFYYLIGVLLEHYLSNSNFYTRVSEPLIKTIKLLLKIAFEGNHANSAPSVFAFYEQIVAVLSEKSFNSKALLEIIFETEEQALNMKLSGLEISHQESKAQYDQMKQKPTRVRSLELVKKLMKSTCQRLITTDIKELDAALIVLEKIFNEFNQNPFAEECGFLREFIQNYMNTSQSLFSQKKYLQRKKKLIELTIQFSQIKQNKFSRMQVSKLIIELNNTFISPFIQEKSIQNLLSYFACIQQMLTKIQTSKLFVIDVFLCSIQNYINDINKNYRKLISSNVNFYQITKSLLYNILEVVELFGGEEWGVKANSSVFEKKYYFSESNENDDEDSSQKGKKFQKENVQWEGNQRDNQLPLIVEEYFYTWVKELGREEYETENLSTWTKEKQQANDKDIVLIYSQFIHLTPNGKLPPLPKAIVQKQRNTQLCVQLQNCLKDELPELEDFSYKETKTTKNLINLYLKHIYRLSSTNLMALYPSIDYRLEYVKKWWEEIMIRSMKPEINVSAVYDKFIKYGHSKTKSETNSRLAGLLFQIANFYKNDSEYLDKILQQPYRIRSMLIPANSNSPNENIQHTILENGTHYNSMDSYVIYEEYKSYVKRLQDFWMYEK